MPRSSNRRPLEPPFRSIEAVAPGVEAVVCRAECSRPGGASRGKPTMAAPPPPGLCSAATEFDENDGILALALFEDAGG
ncbi:hypothetical protein TgHK011_001919 [Trichoderma gracile]|nr:hypothetical protein TgHK011_001919 [Trichoderma gracile]